MTLRATLKQWFSRGRKPTAAQFAEWIDSFWHKSEDTIEISDIHLLPQTLNEKSDVGHKHTLADITDYTDEKEVVNCIAVDFVVDDIEDEVGSHIEIGKICAIIGASKAILRYDGADWTKLLDLYDGIRVICIRENAFYEKYDGEFNSIFAAYDAANEEWVDASPNQDGIPSSAVIYMAEHYGSESDEADSRIYLFNDSTYAFQDVADPTGKYIQDGTIYVRNLTTALAGYTDKGMYNLCYTMRGPNRIGQGAVSKTIFYTFTVTTAGSTITQTLSNHDGYMTRSKVADGDWSNWDESEYSFDGHGHDINDIHDLPETLNGKSDVGHSHDPEDMPGLSSLLSGKANLVENATDGNFAALNTNGNPIDSGKKASDFATAAQGAKADTALQAHQDISGKADKVSGATAGNFAALDANGNPTDSGKKASDFATAAQGAKADTALQAHQDISGKADKVSGATAGNFAALDANGNPTDSGKKAADFATAAQGAKADTALQSHQDISGKQDKTDNTLLTTAKTIVGAINELWNKFTDYLKGIQQITYAQLVTLRNNSGLMPGQWYRITDFITTCANDDEARSAGHPFDLLVVATSTNTLAEEAKVVKSSRDNNNYFAGAKLEAWKVWYCLDNDTTRFKWADDEHGTGVIWRMIDEWGNDCPYDFKNMQFKRYAIDDITSTKLTADALTNLQAALCYDQNGGKHFATKDIYGSWVPCDVDGTSYDIDEDNYGWYYTFHGLSSDDGETILAGYDMSTHHFRMTDECIQYQEDDGCGINNEDECHDNIIKPAFWEYDQDDEYYKGRRVLNNIVFINGLSYCYYNEDDDYWEYTTSSCYGNVFGVECKNNTFGNYFQVNTFGNNCGGNTFGNYCYYNTFGNYFSWNTFGNSCQYNTFGNYCYRNTFGNNCYSNTFGNDCYYNTFGNNDCGNTFGNYCHHNTFGNGCSSNTFGNDCYNNTFGNGCYYNTFGNSCGSNTFGNDCYNNTFWNYCYYNTFGNGCNNNTFANWCYNNTFGNYVRYLTVFDGVQYVSVTGGSSDYSYVQNAQILNGTCGSGSNNLLPIAFAENKNYAQLAGLNSSGILKIWVPADAA